MVSSPLGRWADLFGQTVAENSQRSFSRFAGIRMTAVGVRAEYNSRLFLYFVILSKAKDL
jgi:hypothetical protein